ncbi:MAG TPA: hypothetical protein PLS66_08940 [Tepiditoga sp.]|nr:hypothetical protein [Thermotogota bacterium]HOO75407.1 hypothetical protein [Tepiditoga sp.]
MLTDKNNNSESENSDILYSYMDKMSEIIRKDNSYILSDNNINGFTYEYPKYLTDKK